MKKVSSHTLLQKLQAIEIINTSRNSMYHFERSEKSLTGGAGGEIPPLYVSTLIPTFSQGGEGDHALLFGVPLVTKLDLVTSCRVGS